MSRFARPLRFPTLSHDERDRRWSLTRNFIESNELDCLILTGNEMHPFDNWLTNDRPGQWVLFTRKGQMIVLTWSTQVISSHLESALRGEDSWVTDMRRGSQARHLVTTIQELGLTHGRFGVVGLSAGNLAVEGWIPYTTWSGVLEALPNATFRDIKDDFIPLMLVKSQEELSLVERAAEIGEMACAALVEVTRPGVTEVELYATAMEVMLHNGARSNWLILQTGPDNSSWGQPQWTYRSQPPRTIQAGDIVMAELFPHVGMLEAQVQLCIAVGEMSDEHQECARAARTSLEAGFDVLRQENVTFGDLVGAMEKPVREKGLWHVTPMIHTMNPHCYGGSVATDIEKNLPGIEQYRNVSGMPGRGLDVPLKPGMCFAFEPNAHKGKKRINIGGTVVMRDGEPWNMNEICNQVNIVPA